MYSPSPCTGYIKNFKVNQKWGYSIFDINKVESKIIN